ncbi:MAG: hypothetical protein JRI90_14420 [Deltaproteobacteria bacterium]|nr:hypothetical protein [Deltaproteobacteria bacterium]
MIVYGFINSIILALIALGFSITFGISRVANFAHGAFYVFGGVVTWFFLMKMGLPYVLSAIMAVLIVGIVGGLMYRLLLVRLRGLELSEVITAFLYPRFHRDPWNVCWISADFHCDNRVAPTRNLIPFRSSHQAGAVISRCSSGRSYSPFSGH